MSCTNQTLTFSVPAQGGVPGVPEGVCYDSTRGLFYVGNIFGTRVQSIDPADCSTQEWEGPYDGGTIGCYYNAVMDAVYFANSQTLDIFAGSLPSNVSRIIKTDVTSSTVSVAAGIPDGVLLNDLFVNDDGSLVTTDFLGNLIYHINSAGVIQYNHSFASPNGIRPLSANTFLVGGSVLTKITMGNIWTEHVVDITNSDVMMSFGGYDGLDLLSDGTLAAITLSPRDDGSTANSQVVHLESSDDWMTATVIGLLDGPAFPNQFATLAVDENDDVWALSTDFTGTSTDYFISKVEFATPSSAYAAGLSVLATAMVLMA